VSLPPDARPARTVFFGSGEFAVPILDALARAPEVSLVAVVGPPDRPTGRHATPTPAPAIARARTLGLDVLQPARLRADDAVADVAARAPELGVLADYGRIVPPSILALPPHGILNVHPSLLPRHRGATPIPATLLAGDPEAGVTLIRMDDGIDTGPIVAQERWALAGDETAPRLEAQAAAAGAALLARSLGAWLRGELAASPQDPSGATLTRPLRRADGALDPSRSVAELERQVRAYQPWPGSWLETAVGRLVVWRAEAVPGFASADAVPGWIGRFGLNASDGHLAFREVQPAGGRRMSWDEFVRGRPQIVGSQVVAGASTG
jgi:methionyl-tRNA formyltransferase